MKGKNQRDKTGNVKTTQNNIDRTRQNMEAANELIWKTSEDRLKGELENDNKNREEALKQLHGEVKEKAKHHKP
jgi:small acid-soluble spore protein (thioredoxin-like protein)